MFLEEREAGIKEIKINKKPWSLWLTMRWLWAEPLRISNWFSSSTMRRVFSAKSRQVNPARTAYSIGFHPAFLDKEGNDDNIGASCIRLLTRRIFARVDLCPKPNVTDNPLSKKSHVEDFNEPVPALFQALTAEEDPLQRWIPFTFPVDYDMSLFHSKDKDMTYHMREYPKINIQHLYVEVTNI